MDETKLNQDQNKEINIRIIDRQMPIANVSYIMKDVLPNTGKISKDAKELMGRCASEFIAIITCRAKDICECEARKTITGDDLIRAMEDLDLPYYSEITKIYFDQFKKINGEIKHGKFHGNGIDLSEFMN